MATYEDLSPSDFCLFADLTKNPRRKEIFIETRVDRENRGVFFKMFRQNLICHPQVSLVSTTMIRTQLLVVETKDA